MTDLISALNIVAESMPQRVVLSTPAKGCPYRRVNMIKTAKGYQVEKLTQTQAFHEHVSPDRFDEYLVGFFSFGFSQLNAQCGDGMEYAVKLTKNGKVLTNRKKGAVVKDTGREGHNRRKNYIIPEGGVVPPLIDMGIFTKDGMVIPAMYDKYRQINRFLEIIDDAYSKAAENSGGTVRVLDFGCGKSYLTFALYYYFTEIKGVNAEILGLDLKAGVVSACAAAAEKYGYSGLRFMHGDIAEYDESVRYDMLISLHACDTATDYALYQAIKRHIPMIFVAPCCQHELNAQMKAENLTLFDRYGILKERTAAILTDSIRGNLMMYMGYRTQIMEFINDEHTPKNIMIRGVKAHIPSEKRNEAYAEVMAAVSEFNLEPALLKLLTKIKDSDCAME